MVAWEVWFNEQAEAYSARVVDKGCDNRVITWPPKIGCDGTRKLLRVLSEEEAKLRLFTQLQDHTKKKAHTASIADQAVEEVESVVITVCATGSRAFMGALQKGAKEIGFTGEVIS